MNLVLAHFEEKKAKWRATLPSIWALYFRTWFIIDLVSACSFTPIYVKESFTIPCPAAIMLHAQFVALVACLHLYLVGKPVR